MGRKCRRVKTKTVLKPVNQGAKLGNIQKKGVLKKIEIRIALVTHFEITFGTPLGPHGENLVTIGGVYLSALWAAYGYLFQGSAILQLQV